MESRSSEAILTPSDIASQAPKRGYLGRIIQATVGVGALILVLTQIDHSKVVAVLLKVDLKLLLLAILLNLVMTYLMAIRWQWLLSIKYNLSSITLLRHYLVGQFFNLFTPGAVGGDLSRFLAVNAQTGDKSFVFTTLILERLVGLAGLVVSGVLGLYLGRQYLDHAGIYYGATVLLALATLASSAIFSSKLTQILINLVIKIEQFLGKMLISNKLTRIASQFAIFRQHKGILLLGVGLTFIVRVVWGLSCYLVAQAMGLSVPFTILIAYISIVDMARMAPIAPPNGIGLREYLFILLLGHLAISPTQAALFAFIAYTLLMLNGIIGGIIYTTRTFIKP